MASRSARGRAVRLAARLAALLLALSGGPAGAQETDAAAAGAAPAAGADARGAETPAVAPEALLELPYVYPLLPMRPPPAPR